MNRTDYVQLEINLPKDIYDHLKKCADLDDITVKQEIEQYLIETESEFIDA